MSTVVEPLPPDAHSGDDCDVTETVKTHSVGDHGPDDHGPDDQGPDLNKLEDRTPEWMRLSRATGGWTALLGILYLLLSYQPLYHTDLWGHLSYGRWIFEHGQLPTTEPLLPLCDGVPMVDTAWLSQLIGFGMYEQFGVTAMQFLYASSITAAFVMLLIGVLRKTRGSILGGLIAIGTFFWVDYQQLLIVRPQLAGLVLFVALFVLMKATKWRSVYWFLVPAMFALWANLHGSWIVGLGLLGTMCVGRAIDVARRTKSVKSLFADSHVRRLFVLTEIAAVAILINPHGFGLYPEVFAISANVNLHDLIEWDPLTLRMSQGRAAAVAVFALMFAYRLSPRRVSATEVLLLAGLGGAALWSSRMIHWWAPLAAYYLALHAASIWRVWRRPEESETSRNGLMAVVTVGLMWIFFAYTPFGATVIHGQPTKPGAHELRFAKSTSDLTPLTAVAYLNKNPVEGLVFNTYEWGDFLGFAGPPGLKLFTNSHAHLIPEEVWSDALTILRAGKGWDDKLDRYGVNVVVLNSQSNDALIRTLKRETSTWEVAYADRVATVFRRRKAI